MNPQQRSHDCARGGGVGGEIASTRKSTNPQSMQSLRESLALRAK